MQQDPNADKNSLHALWLIFGLFSLGLVIWYFFGDALKMFFIHIRYYQAWALSFILPEFKRTATYLSFLDPENLSLDYAYQVSFTIGRVLVVPVSIVCALLAYAVFSWHVGARYTRSHSMETLMRQEQNNWPQIAPVVEEKMMEMDINKGPWAMAMSPMEFARHHKLLDVEIVGNPKAAWRSEAVYKTKIKQDKAHQVFIQQLGPFWQGLHKLPPHTLALFAVFAARIEHDSSSAQKMLRQFSTSFARGHIDYSGVNALVRKYIQSKAVQRCCQKHAYVLTMMAAMLELARTDGVLACADFLWLKKVDRSLWYMLNNVGRQTAFVEVAGAFAHWKVEKELARPLHVPVVHTAIMALELAVAKVVFEPTDEELDEIKRA